MDDFVARLGGDEFVVLIDEASSELEVLASAYRILDLVSGPVEHRGPQVIHTASIGIAIAELGDDQSALDLLSWADVAMYVAKARGRNQAVIFDEELREAANERTSIELLLARSYRGRRTSPALPARSRPANWPIACRSRHSCAGSIPLRGIVAAADFIKVAEETGLVLDIGRWVFAEACRQLAEWRDEYPDLPLVVRVNMSPVEFVGRRTWWNSWRTAWSTNDVPGRPTLHRDHRVRGRRRAREDARDPERLPEARRRSGYRRLRDRVSRR